MLVGCLIRKHASYVGDHSISSEFQQNGYLKGEAAGEQGLRRRLSATTTYHFGSAALGCEVQRGLPEARVADIRRDACAIYAALGKYCTALYCNAAHLF